ncbi:MAG: YtfJ family protein [Candidatus Margulisiibacteriota bacterium]
MNRRTWLIFMTIVFVASLAIVSFAAGLELGSKAPFFKVKSGAGEELTQEMIKEKVIVIFYETKDVVERNRQLKNELNKFYDEQPDAVKKNIVRLPIINCSGAFWPFSLIWESSLKENSKKEGLTIYGDWNGKVFSNYMMKDNESNVAVIDKKGMLRYIAFGKIEAEEINKIKELLRGLARPSSCGL